MISFNVIIPFFLLFLRVGVTSLTIVRPPLRHDKEIIAVRVKLQGLTRQSRTTTVHALPLIPADDQWGNWMALTGLATAAQILGRTTVLGRLLGPPVSAMALTFAAATVGLLNPGGTMAAKSLQSLSLQLATPLVLLGADLRDAVSKSGSLVASFCMASFSTVFACLVGWKLNCTRLSSVLGRDGLVIAAALLAKNIGGGINYIAVCRCLQASDLAIAAGLCVDNLFALVYFPITSALANGFPDVAENRQLPKDDMKSPSPRTSESNFSVQNITTILFLSALLLWLGEKTGGVNGALPACTIFTVLFASIVPLSWLAPLRPCADRLGLVSLYLFFATAGAPGALVAKSVRASLVPLALFLTSLYSLHGILLFLSCYFWGNQFAAFYPQRLLVASSAAIGGPATAVALAKAADWKSLSVPSVLVGNLGYAIATFLGLAFYSFFQ
jgi:uncharacterized membrane protein